MLNNYKLYNDSLAKLPEKKLLITTINAHSYNISRKEEKFRHALENSDILIPDGISIVWAVHLLFKRKIVKIAGADLFTYEMNRMEELAQLTGSARVFFLGSTNSILDTIKNKASIDFPNVSIYSYSPPYRKEFTEHENLAIIHAINQTKPNVLFIGMTAPKQEKWAYDQFKNLKCGHICCIGAVFDFYAGTIKRAPKWMIKAGLEWFFRFIKEPRRMWHRYIVGNPKFVLSILSEKFLLKKDHCHSLENISFFKKKE